MASRSVTYHKNLAQPPSCGYRSLERDGGTTRCPTAAAGKKWLLWGHLANGSYQSSSLSTREDYDRTEATSQDEASQEVVNQDVVQVIKNLLKRNPIKKLLVKKTGSKLVEVPFFQVFGTFQASFAQSD
ncbi:hypothetical protein BGZ65_012715 [Modicella reniformis]|uniref:Uncharacterized protein n=1 Tax=Modicella reniformis TaxID=1440133 RepID=A0A9P6J3J9_9FUNG|nr:hypothetical protein BGZ65_012715 [Modicella reniformis]